MKLRKALLAMGLASAFVVGVPGAALAEYCTEPGDPNCTVDQAVDTTVCVVHTVTGGGNPKQALDRVASTCLVQPY